MWVVLCEVNDLAALWAYQGLIDKGLQPLELISSQALSYALKWDHQVGSEIVNVKIQLTNDKMLDGSEIKGVLNRLVVVHTEHLARFPDREYAMQEYNALFLSWLNSIPARVINRAVPYGLSGQWRHLSEWIWMASKSGLYTPKFRQSSDIYNNTHTEPEFQAADGLDHREVIVACGHVIGSELPDNISKGSKRLSDISGTDLLGIRFAVDSSENWIFESATPLPDLRLGGDELIEILAKSLKGTGDEQP